MFIMIFSVLKAKYMFVKFCEIAEKYGPVFKVSAGMYIKR